MIVRPHETLPEVLIVEPDIHRDERGAFSESWNDARYRDAGIPGPFVQDNLVRSVRAVLRGLHFQNPAAQGKLVCAVRGSVFDVAVDIRVGSPTFGKAAAVTLDDVSRRQLWVPRGFAHGYCVLSGEADVLYKVDAPYRREHEGVVAWNDPDLAIAWPVAAPVLNARDGSAPRLRDIANLPRYGA
jgi:dTDP-4-dehydrorhamnose 3,5-epimerase